MNWKDQLRKRHEELRTELQEIERMLPDLKQKRNISPEVREKMSRLMKDRWAAARESGKATI